MASHLRPGDMAPTFDLPDQHAGRVRLDAFRGRALLVYFYPAAFSVDCTAQSCSVRDHRADLASLGIDVIGVSTDEPERQRAFDLQHSLGFPLLSDPDHAVADEYGVWTDYEYAGAVVTGVLRSAFLLDARGALTHVWSPVDPGQMMALVQEAVAEAPAS